MKEITKKFLESGIVDRTIAKMMERWGMLTPAELEIATAPKAVIHETLSNFIEEIELLNQPEAIERKETQLDPLLSEVYDPTKGH
jgi:hypothetical protein